MKEAGISVVRMGESTWGLWAPADGQFEYAWMDRIVDAVGKAGIKVIMGTPTSSVPTWMWKAHPEILARPLGGAYVGYGMRQNMNTDDPNYRRYAERLIGVHVRSEEHTSELQSHLNLVCRLLLEKKKTQLQPTTTSLTTSNTCCS